jgi:hypothetical protein
MNATKSTLKYMSVYNNILLIFRSRIQTVDGRKKNARVTKTASKNAGVLLGVSVMKRIPNEDMSARAKTAVTVPYITMPKNPGIYGKESPAFDIPMVTRKIRNHADTESIDIPMSYTSFSNTCGLNFDVSLCCVCDSLNM